MVIGIDCRFASTSTGLGRYVRELVRELLRRSDGTRYVLFCDAEKPSWIPADAVADWSVRVVRARHYSLSEQIVLPWVLLRARLDLFLAPHFNVPFLCPVPFVAVIHDLILHRYPNAASVAKQRAYRMQMAFTTRRARRLIAVSRFTASEIKRVYGAGAAKKTVVIHEAVGDAFRPSSAARCAPVLKKYGLQKPFFLYVGNCKEHKNVQALLDGYEKLSTDDTELVLVTGGPESERLRLPRGVRVLRGVPDDDLPCLYFYAACFVSASLYEGFGLPALEAQACGCPCILSDRTSFPEIAPPGTKLVEPTPEGIAEALADPPPPPSERPSRSWSHVAAETVDLLLRAARNG